MKLLLALLPLGFIAIPIYVWRWSRVHRPRYRFAITGATFGLIADPFSSAMYGLFFLSCLTAPFGLFGLILSQLHSTPGYELSAVFRWHDRHTVVRGELIIAIAMLNGVIWAMVYGGIGALVDLTAAAKRRKAAAHDEKDAG